MNSLVIILNRSLTNNQSPFESFKKYLNDSINKKFFDHLHIYALLVESSTPEIISSEII